MEPFQALTVGTKFNKSTDLKYQKLFQKKPINISSSSILEELSGPDTIHSVEDVATIPCPPPAHTLSLSRTDTQHPLQSLDACGSGHSETEKNKDKPLPKMTFKKIKHIWRKHDLRVTGTDTPQPIEHFSDLVRPPIYTPHHIVDNLFRRAHKVPTPIQTQAIPTLVHRRDLLACAPTGSGKTIAFLVPMFTLLKAPDRTAGVRALIVTPTMELAMQIEREAFLLMHGNRWRYVQHGQTTKDKDFFVSTPARVVNLLEQKLLDLSNVEFLVFDEGDRLWDPKSDFFAHTDQILTSCKKPEKVVCLFTATLSEKIEEAARSVMSNPIRLIVKGRKNANSNVEQRLVFCGSELGKIVAMRQLIREGLTAPVLIFVQSIERSKELYDEINASGLHMRVMNAKMTTDEREDIVLQYRLGKIWVLVTTELLARGIDFKNVNTVINFDFPQSAESYIHRVGRTGRAGRSGLAITFFTIDDKERLPPIARIMKDSGSPVEDWMLDMKVDRSTRRRLMRTTPKRMVVSTRKRVMIADKRYNRELRRLEAETEGKTESATDSSEGKPRKKKRRLEEPNE